MSNPVQFKNRLSQSVPADKKRSRQLDWEDTRKPAWVAWLSVLCVIAILVGVLALSGSDRTSAPQNINGDRLGPYDVATTEEYEQQAADAMAAMEGDAPRWALVTPREPMQPRELAGALQSPKLRVSTLLVGPIQWVTPEPAAGQRRADVLRQAEESMAVAAGLRPSDIRADGVLVYGAPEELKAVDESPDVRAVEPAHPGAVYGRMGVRPVVSPEVGA